MIGFLSFAYSQNYCFPFVGNNFEERGELESLLQAREGEAFLKARKGDSSAGSGGQNGTQIGTVGVASQGRNRVLEKPSCFQVLPNPGFGSVAISKKLRARFWNRFSLGFQEQETSRIPANMVGWSEICTSQGDCVPPELPPLGLSLTAGKPGCNAWLKFSALHRF